MKKSSLQIEEVKFYQKIMILIPDFIGDKDMI